MPNDTDLIKNAGNFMRRSVTLKIGLVGFLILLLLIPAAMIQNLITERQSRRDSVVKEISQKWADGQTVTGPFITVPFKTYFKDADGKARFNLNTLQFLPETLDVTGEIRPEVRYRSLFEAVLYNADLQFSGSFKLPQKSRMNVDPAAILWDKASLSLGITDLRGIREKIVFALNQKEYAADPGLNSTDLAAAGVSARIGSVAPDETVRFSFDLNLNGSEQLSLVPVGETSVVRIRSTWPSPSFNGAFLPAGREVAKDGFAADWKILHINRNYPQFWENAQYRVSDSAFGVKLILTADIYQKSMRLAKYSIMFLVFTFATFFFSEIMNKRRIHPIQYVLIGLAVLIFYALVLALSEHMRFNLAYLLSAASVTCIISGYAKAISSNPRFALTVLGVLTVLYGYLFVVLQLEDYALISGSVALLVILAAVMFMTRKIDWYAIEAGRKEG
jgi:inner membrane protein